MSRVVAVEPTGEALAQLPAADFADAYRRELAIANLGTRAAATAAFTEPPAWVDVLMALRNILVAPLGLETGHTIDPARRRIGLFPLLSESTEAIVMGLDDKHLDFRILVTAKPVAASRSEITATTVVRTHNALGRNYLRVVLPFHRVIVRHFLRRARFAAQGLP